MSEDDRPFIGDRYQLQGLIARGDVSIIYHGRDMRMKQLQGEIATSASDVYAFGVVIYEMLTGHALFDGDTPAAVAMQHIQDAPIPPSQFNPSIPPSLEKIILRCLEKVPERRYRDGSELAQALNMLDNSVLL